MSFSEYTFGKPRKLDDSFLLAAMSDGQGIHRQPGVCQIPRAWGFDPGPASPMRLGRCTDPVSLWVPVPPCICPRSARNAAYPYFLLDRRLGPVNKYRLHFGASAGRAHARRRGAGDAVPSSRSGNAADAPPPSRPFGLRPAGQQQNVTYIY
jgi:hypothetical protein